MSDEEIRARLQALHEDVQEKIERFGWTAIGVMPEAGSPGWTYTIGLSERGWPEIAVWALPSDYGHAIVTSAIEEWEKNGGPPVDGVVSEELANMPVTYRWLQPSPELDNAVRQALVHYGEEHSPGVVQIVWPDQQGKFPWEPECDARYAKWQSAVVDWRPGGDIQLS